MEFYCGGVNGSACLGEVVNVCFVLTNCLGVIKIRNLVLLISNGIKLITI